MNPIVHGLEEKYGNQIEFVYLNIDDPNTEGYKRALGYRVQPHFFLLDGQGKVTQQWLGLIEASEFENAFEMVIRP